MPWNVGLNRLIAIINCHLLGHICGSIGLDDLDPARI